MNTIRIFKITLKLICKTRREENYEYVVERMLSDASSEPWQTSKTVFFEKSQNSLSSMSGKVLKIPLLIAIGEYETPSKLY